MKIDQTSFALGIMVACLAQVVLALLRGFFGAAWKDYKGRRMMANTSYPRLSDEEVALAEDLARGVLTDRDAVARQVNLEPDPLAAVREHVANVDDAWKNVDNLWAWVRKLRELVGAK